MGHGRHFYSHQPDQILEPGACATRSRRSRGFWSELGVDGFLVLDAVPFLLEAGAIPGDVGLRSQRLPGGPAVLHRPAQGWRVAAGRGGPARREPLRAFFGDQGDELQLLFNFPVMEAMYRCCLP